MTPTWAVVPFPLYLLVIAGLPIFLGRFWDSNRNKLAVAVAVSVPVAIYLLTRPGGAALVADTARDYLAFVALLGALFVISGGIHLRGALAGTPATNTAFLAAGALLANVVGTTGASALLIRPLLRANQGRRCRHIVVFFIFIVSNGGGMLTPLGDPPLFLGFLRGVPFTWTLRLAAPWAMVNGALLVMFALFDLRMSRREPARRREGLPVQSIERLRIEGAVNLVWLLGVVATVLVAGSYGRHWFGEAAGTTGMELAALIAFAALSLATTPRRIHEANRFSWAPILEVAVVFVGVFFTMTPALSFLQERGAALGITEPWQFFWASGVLSSVLDNAPTYLTFASLASGVASVGGPALSVNDLGALAAHPTGHTLLAAVSCGSVFMGAITYIGNGPNFMVKAIAEQHHVRMPSFGGYMLWSLAILVPLFGAVALVWF